jgi:ABC-type dipeptide/oligopeptide/nickel transport system permease component
MKLMNEDYMRMVRAMCAPKRRTLRQWARDNAGTIEMWLWIAAFAFAVALIVVLHVVGGAR